MNQFKYSNDNKRYHTFNYYLKNKYHCKVAKVGLNAGFTCPNRDGSKGVGGCIFCSDSGSGDFAGNVHDSLQTQFNQVSQILSNKWPGCNNRQQHHRQGLFQSEHRFPLLQREAGGDQSGGEGVYLPAAACDLWVELGLQTIHDRTGLIINRCHSYQDFLDGLNKLRALNINVCVHIINGLPYETPEMMLETAKTVGQLDIQAIKIHMLYVIKNTVLEKMYDAGKFSMLSREEYIDLVVQQLRYIPEHVVIERLTGDGKVSDLIAPLWSIKKVTIINDIDKKMKADNIYQGDLVK